MIDEDNGVGHDVITESIGQFTGLQDKNGKDIYHSDSIFTQYSRIKNMKTPNPKFSIGQTVYVFTKDGLQARKIERICIFLSEALTSIRYGFSYDEGRYEESQVIADYPRQKPNWKRTLINLF